MPAPPSGLDKRREFLPFATLSLLLFTGLLLHRYAAGQDFLQAVFFTLRLLLIEDSVAQSDFTDRGNGGWWPTYQCLRIAVPIVASWFLVKSYLNLIGSNGSWLSAFLRPGDVLIIGGGLPARQLALEHARRGQRVALLTLEPESPTHADLASHGIKVFGGNGLITRNLAWLRARRTPVVYIIADGDTTNIAILETLIALHGEKASAVPHQVCLVHVLDDFLTARVSEADWHTRSHGHCQVRVFNVWKNSTRRLLSHATLSPHRAAYPDASPHVLMLGFSWMGRCILEQLARQGHYADGGKARLSIVTPDAQRVAAQVYAGFPALNPPANTADVDAPPPLSMIDLDFIDAPVDGLSAEALRERPPITIAYVCTPTLQEGISAAHALLTLSAEHTFAIVLCVQEQVSPTIHRQITSLKRCEIFDTITAGLCLEDHEPVLGEFSEREAALADLAFRDGVDSALLNTMISQLRPPGSKRPPLPQQHSLWSKHLREHWFALQEWERESSRDAVRHLTVKDTYFSLDQLSEKDKRRVSRLEHQRWCAERLMSGWRPATTTDRGKREHGSLVDFDSLSEREQQKDETVVKISSLLALARKHGRP